MIIVGSPALQAFIERELLNQQSLAAIVGRLVPGLDEWPYVCRDTIEKFILKSADIFQYGEEYLAFVEARLNSRFMGILGYKIPQKYLEEHRALGKPTS